MNSILVATLATSSAQNPPAPARPYCLAAPTWTWSASQAGAQVWQAAAPLASAPAPTAGSPPPAAGYQPGLPEAGAPLLVSSPAWHVHLLRLLFQLVLRPELAGGPAARLAAHTQLPVAAVRQVLGRLAAQGYWAEGSAPGTSPLRLPAPAHYWLAHYAGTLRRRLNAQRYRPRHPATLATWSQRALPAGCLWGGEVAARRLLGCPALPASATIYSQLPRPALVQQLDLVPAPKGSIELLNAFAPAGFHAAGDADCVPPLLAYADLLASQKPEEAALAHELRARYLTELVG
ncbi:MAG TPA: type IV toxin-antitoxin system AbiEi family antitoxin [Hymenobacter sp.]|uniref:type IV toxin-antitoxin system AbiEi family antitoxin n=1 Tax=Hymenobacter sp. TaxID=1898978 RepID=UPI002D81119F|nr:type IV toxin-antitoxin system AbiEi family antitoxin [Hymenobacter sp.]HET9506221.1 type IV toxin-antitoxin system AbiEi family antitoxin [Hymenobacter sp.]